MATVQEHDVYVNRPMRNKSYFFHTPTHQFKPVWQTVDPMRIMRALYDEVLRLLYAR